MQADVLVELIRQALAGNQPAIRQSVERSPMKNRRDTASWPSACRKPCKRRIRRPERPHRLSPGKAALRHSKRSITRLNPHADREFGEITAFMMIQLKTVSKKHHN